MVYYVIVSYDRPEVVFKKSLKMLRENKIPLKNIVVVVANKEQKKLYNQVLENKYNIMIGEKGVVQVRNWVRRQFHGKRIVMMDDDISGMYKYTDMPGKEYGQFKKITNLNKWVNKGFKLMEKTGGRLCGFNATLNGMSANHDIQRGLILLGGIYCEHCDKAIQLQPPDATIDDKFICMEYYEKYGDIVRYNGISHNAAQGGRVNEGGIQSIMTMRKREQDSLKATKRFINKYKKYISSYKIVQTHQYGGMKYYRIRWNSGLVKGVGHS